MISIQEFIVDQLEKTSLLEMGYDRRDYKMTVRNLMNQIIENWCLIRYCTLSGREETKSHWQQELFSYLQKLYRMQIKLDKTKATREELLIYPENDNYENILWTISEKWQQENLNIDSEETLQTAKDCSEYGIEEMIDIISGNKGKTYNHIKEYIKNI